MRSATRAVLFVSATWLAGAPGAAAQAGTAGAPRSPRNASYTIEARLDPASRTITGSEVITWRNITSRPTGELQFHLYWNAWRDARSTWLREASLGGRRTGPDPRPDDWARLDINSLALVDPATSVRRDLTERRFIAPDDGNADDATVLQVQLPLAVAPGETARISVTWTAHVPRTFARTGAIGDFFFIAQWFPKLGVLQDEGWNCHQFHAGTEFFSDYGVYDVSLTVPGTWVVGATGVERESRANGDGTSTHRFYQEDVHDFAWTTSPDFVVRTARFDEPGLPAVEMRLLLQPEHVGQEERHFAATRVALKYYGQWFGPYPYGHITIVDPAFQSGAGGMEYPTLFTAGTRWLVLPGVTSPEEVTIHEAGHQFWYGIVGNNEFEDAWMDEGFNTFSTARAIAQAYPVNSLSLRYFGGFVPWRITGIRMRRETDDNRLDGYRRAARSDAQSTPTYRYFPATGGNITYNKTALWLNTLERWLGWPTLQRVMATHFDRWKFRHPRPDDFFATANEVSGRDLTGFFDQVYRSSNVFDYGIGQLTSERSGSRFRTNVVVRRYGEAIFPVDVLVTFANGDRTTERWDGKGRWRLYTYDRPVRALSAQVDSNRVLLLDVNYTNNSRTLEPKGAQAATKWAAVWMVWLQDALLSYGFFV
jgi:hypothetical protein